jgi:hypothetical protein
VPFSALNPKNTPFASVTIIVNEWSVYVVNAFCTTAPALSFHTRPSPGGPAGPGSPIAPSFRQAVANTDNRIEAIRIMVPLDDEPADPSHGDRCNVVVTG